MKKLLLLCLLLCGFHLHAQKSQAFDIAIGPNWLKVFSGANRDGPYFPLQTGWGAGVDYNFGISKRVNVKIGLRYHASASVAERNNLRYESEYSTGTYVYDSTLQHAVRTEYQNQAWSYLVGTRLYFNSLKTWRCYANMEFGLTHHRQPQSSSSPSLYVTGGLGLGVQWMPPKQRFGIFLQPVLRYMNSQQGNEYPFVVPAIEIGLRSQLFGK